jgi:hypothetical protein
MYMNSFAFYMIFFLMRGPFMHLAEAAGMPLHICLFPRKQYGQFASANGTVRSGTMLLGTIAGGWFINFFESRLGPRGDGYCFLWLAIFQCVAFGAMFVTYLYWKAHGAEKFTYDPDKPFDEPVPLPAAIPVEIGSPQQEEEALAAR